MTGIPGNRHRDEIDMQAVYWGVIHSLSLKGRRETGVRQLGKKKDNSAATDAQGNFHKGL